jgi:hypothetical protein
MSAMGGKLTEAQCEGAPMRLVAILWMAAMIALIVGLDVTLFKNHFYERSRCSTRLKWTGRHTSCGWNGLTVVLASSAITVIFHTS